MKNKETTGYERVGISNPARFFTGIGMISLEVLALFTVFLSLLNWSFFTKQIAIILIISILVVVYNVFAGILLLKGSKGKNGG